MALSSSATATGAVPPGFRFHPTDEELLMYYLKKKVSFEKFELEVIREVDLNKTEPWDLQERCRIGSTPQNEWYFFSHKDRKYPTGSRTNRATFAGFWKATGRDKCIRTTYKKIGMRKTLVFYRGRAPHGQKTDWIMHEYRLEDSDDTNGQSSASGTNEDGWVICRVFKKKCFFKVGGSLDRNNNEGSLSQGTEDHMLSGGESHSQPRPLTSHYIHPNLYHHHHHQTPNLYYNHMPTSSYSHVQVQDLLTNHRPSSTAGYDFPVLPNDSSNIEVGACQAEEGRGGEWVGFDGMDGRFSAAGASSAVQQLGHGQLVVQQRGGEMDLWGYGK